MGLLDSSANCIVAEEEKKVVASLLGKLYISPGSSEDRLREAYTEVTCAVDDDLLKDATSRNALYKVHVSLGKIVNALDQSQPANNNSLRSSTRSASVATDTQTVQEGTVVGEADILEEVEEGEPAEEDEEQTVVLKKEQDTSMDEGESQDGDVTE
jgi:condensin complex subunit 3